jgi:hypothetical protein
VKKPVKAPGQANGSMSPTKNKKTTDKLASMAVIEQNIEL